MIGVKNIPLKAVVKPLELIRTADRMDGLGASVFVTFTQLANKYESVNLGQGTFAGMPAPLLIDSVKESIVEPVHQYGRPAGNVKLMNTLSQYYSPQMNVKLDPMTNITTGIGAQGLINNIFLSFMQSGDEYIVIEPFFDAYINAGKLTQSTPVGVPYVVNGNTSHVTDASQFTFDYKTIKAKITPRTKLMIINTPHNPLGKLHTREELLALADIIKEHPQIIVISDEVYEFMTFENQPHVRFASLPGMFERTLSLYSAGKTFSATGWRLGYAIGPEHLVKPLMIVHQTLNFCAVTLVEDAFNRAFMSSLPSSDFGNVGMNTELASGSNRSYMKQLAGVLEKNRNYLISALKACGLKYITPHGGYFVIADTSDLDTDKMGITFNDKSDKVEDQRDYQVAVWLTTTIKVTGIPLSPFYSPENRHLARNYIRFAYCKDEQTLLLAKERLSALKDYYK